MKETAIRRVKVRKISAPLIMPFTISSGSHKNLENVLIEVELKNGIKGFGEAPIAAHITGEKIELTQKNLLSFGKKISGFEIENYWKLMIMAEEQLEKNRAALFAAQTAVIDAFCKTVRIPMWKLYGSKPFKAQTDITVVIGSAKDAFDFTLAMRRRGFKIFKIKVGTDFDADINRVMSAAKAAPGCEIYIDANCAYSAREALSFISELKKRGIPLSLVEQPVKKDDYCGLAEVSAKTDIPVLADESAYGLEDAARIIKGRLATGINIKLTKFGLLRAAEIRRLALACGVKLMIGQMMESQLATFAALHFALGSGGFDFLDLDTPYFLAKGLMKYPKKCAASNGVYDIRPVKEGAGVQPA